MPKKTSQSQLALLEPEEVAEVKPARASKGVAKTAPKKSEPSAAPKTTARSALKGSATKSEAPPPRPPRVRAPRGSDDEGHSDARAMATRQREISVSEFFSKNRHLLGFDNPAKALLTTIKEAVDNSLDACEEAGILPDLKIEIVELSETRYRVVVEDNGPGIVRQQVPRVFGSLLYGSKFHRLRQSRGQQGIGISAAGMYGQLTTGKPIIIRSKIHPKKPAHHFEIQIDTKKNMPVVGVDKEIEWDVPHGTRVELELEATYKRGKRTVDGYIEQTALANPHARFVYKAPKDPEVIFERAANELPKAPMEIKPHPHGIELG
ncbi:MAG TPA: DNA topoisomerase VI subunit B, partial [Candidatus Eisenbacteria bacterium]